MLLSTSIGSSGKSGTSLIMHANEWAWHRKSATTVRADVLPTPVGVAPEVHACYGAISALCTYPVYIHVKRR